MLMVGWAGSSGLPLFLVYERVKARYRNGCLSSYCSTAASICHYLFRNCCAGPRRAQIQVDSAGALMLILLADLYAFVAATCIVS